MNIDTAAISIPMGKLRIQSQPGDQRVKWGKVSNAGRRNLQNTVNIDAGG